MDNSLKALIVEDEPAIRRILSRKIKRLNYEVFECEKVEEARKILGTQKIDLLFLDYVLADGTSKELLTGAWLNKISQVYLMSAFMDEIEKNLFKDLNLQFLKKPFEDLSGVLKRVEELKDL